MTQSARVQMPFWIIIGLTMVLYTLNFQVNDIWTENESFYAESTREMIEKNDFVDITYNYQPRFNKPPLTYWLIAASVKCFGLNEFAIRLPVVILAFWTALLTWSMTNMLYGKRTALLAFAMQAVGIQVIAGKQYASPEIPLAFFFTLTLYWFLKGQLTRKKGYLLLSAAALGLTVLTKGYPYIIVITGIMMLYLAMESDFRPKEFLNRIRALPILPAIAIVALVGLGWYGLMYQRFGDSYLSILGKETVDRALTRESNGISGIFFYPEVIMWGFFPYSVVLLFAVPFYVKNRNRVREIALGFSWLVVMLVVFTSAKGKLPTYFIQAHPALAMICSHFAMQYRPRKPFIRTLWKLAFFLPSVAAVAISAVLISIFSLPVYFYLIPAATLLAVVLPLLFKPSDQQKENPIRFLSTFQPYIGMISLMLVFSAGVLPRLEEKRPYDQIGKAINEQSGIPVSTPIYLQDGMLHNLPFYARREVIADVSAEKVLRQPAPLLALVRSADLPDSLKSTVIWSGEIYRRRSSESRLMLFIESYLKSLRHNPEGFVRYSLIYKKPA